MSLRLPLNSRVYARAKPRSFVRAVAKASTTQDPHWARTVISGSWQSVRSAPIGTIRSPERSTVACRRSTSAGSASSRRRVVEMALDELRRGQAAPGGPQPGAGQRLGRVVDADHRSPIRPDREAVMSSAS